MTRSMQTQSALKIFVHSYSVDVEGLASTKLQAEWTIDRHFWLMVTVQP